MISADILSLMMTGLNLLMLVAFFAISWTAGKWRLILTGFAIVSFLLFVANHVAEGYRQTDYSLSVDLITLTATQAAGSFLIGRLAELIIRNFLLRDRQGPE